MKERQKPAWRNFIGLGAALLLIAIVNLFTTVNVTLGETELKVRGDFLSNSTIVYSNIQNIALRDTLQIGSRSMGASTLKVHSGQYKNTEIGKYRLFAFKNVPAFIVIETTDGTTVLNASNADATKELYLNICSRAGITPAL